MSLQDDLLKSARRWAAGALTAFAADATDYDFAVHHMAVAVEHMSKAYLCSVSPVLLAGERPNLDDLLLLAGHAGRTNKKLIDLRTISGEISIARAEQVLRQAPANPQALKRLREARNGVAHLAQNADPSQNRELLAAGIRYIDQLLAELGHARDAFWHASEPLVDDIVQQAISDLELRFRHKLGRAKSLFARRFADMTDEARNAQIAALAAVPMIRWGLLAPVACPACASPAVASGREYSEDFGTWFSPRSFGCRVCELRLEGDELRLAGIDQKHFADLEAERLEEEYGDWEPDEDDYERLAMGLDEREDPEGDEH